VIYSAENCSGKIRLVRASHVGARADVVNRDFGRGDQSLFKDRLTSGTSRLHFVESRRGTQRSQGCVSRPRFRTQKKKRRTAEQNHDHIRSATWRRPHAVAVSPRGLNGHREVGGRKDSICCRDASTAAGPGVVGRAVDRQPSKLDKTEVNRR
jgi:hypothetical protein